MLKSKLVIIGTCIIVPVILLIVVITPPLMSEDKPKNEISVGINKTYHNYSYIYINNLTLQFTRLYNQTSANDKSTEKISILSGVWNIKNGEIIQESYDGDAKVLMGNSNWTDIIIEGKIKFLKEITGGIGILWRAEDGATYDAMFQDKASIFAYGKPDGEDMVELTRNLFKPNVNEYYKFKAIVFRKNITLYVENGKKIAIVDDPRLNRLKGKIGLRTWSQKASFKDISVKSITNQTLNLTVSYSFNVSGFTNISLNQYLFDKQSNPTGALSYTSIYTFPSINYTSNIVSSPMNDTLNLSFPADLIRSPDIIYFPTERYKRTFAIRLIVRGWDEQKQEWAFKEFMSPEFTWEDVADGRTIVGDSENKTE